ncbi:hypothetical protein IRT45_35440 [Nocardia sp. BSTN01]|uniref:hypothetical protein n=1 Tax=Nocardia sp. BSTN01 TaxID=2783665 RepID=UPI00188F1035|nr:hypothetical protein [Nocardia sp. BSTN01]MBF5002413.1 hypothetical protein [Nocardia sp. BSTN01]
MNTDIKRIAIAVLRIEIRGGNDEADMVGLAERLGYRLHEQLVEIDPDREGPLVTVTNAIRHAGAEAVIVPDLQHVDGIDEHIRQRALLITVEGERIMQRSAAVA